MNERNKRIITILSIFTIIFTVMGGSLAYWNWSSTTRTSVKFTMDKEFSCSADGGGNIAPTNISLEPSTCDNPNTAIKRKIVVTPNIKRNGLNISLDLWLNINSIGGPLSNSENLKYVVTTNENSCTTDIVSSGNFKGLTANDKAHLLQNKTYTQTQTDTYYLYIWLDKEETDIATANQSFSFSLGGECTDKPNPEAPLLDENSMIPVTIDNNGKVTTISADDPDWYNYENKQWANVVLVEDATRREYYLSNLSNNVSVTSTDITEYYVWIPRYKYRISTNRICGEIKGVSEATHPSCYGLPYEFTIDEIEAKRILVEYMMDFYEQNGMSVAGPNNLTELEELDEWLFSNIVSYDNLINDGFINDEMTGGGSIYLTDIYEEGQYRLSLNPSKIYSTPTSINIIFEKQNDTISLGNAMSTYRTHSAFWNDIDNDKSVDDGELLPGIWMAKFESKDITEQCTEHEIASSTCVAEYRIVPYDNWDNYYSGGGEWMNTGLDASVLERKMVKNSGWGAVAYLSHSSYGLNGEVKNNNVEYGSGSATYTQSTTGNISGVFDMADGLNDYVDASELNIPSEYGLISSKSISCNGGICYGHGIEEVENWYSTTFPSIYYEGINGSIELYRSTSNIFGIILEDRPLYEDLPPRMALMPKIQ